MEELIVNDATYEVFANTTGAQLLDRTLNSYPSEKSSFQVYLGSDGYSNFETEEELNKKDKSKKDKPKIDPEKLAEGITATAGAISSVGTTIQSFKKEPSQIEKELRAICGKKPVLKKNRATYDNCVSEFNKSRLVQTTSSSKDNSEEKNEKTKNVFTTKNIVIGLVVVGVVVTAFVGFKKGWFGK